MDNLLNATIIDEGQEIKELISAFVMLPREDRAILLSNANALKVRSDIEKARKATGK